MATMPTRQSQRNHYLNSACGSPGPASWAPARQRAWGCALSGGQLTPAPGRPLTLRSFTHSVRPKSELLLWVQRLPKRHSAGSWGPGKSCGAKSFSSPYLCPRSEILKMTGVQQLRTWPGEAELGPSKTPRPKSYAPEWDYIRRWCL